MTPTQAQIDAAIKAYSDADTDDHADAIAVALTAAAEVGKPVRSEVQPTDVRGYVEGLKDGATATIERCAEKIRTEFAGDEYAGVFVDEAIAAIRALKDKSEIWDTAVAQTEAKLRAADFAAKHNFDGWQQEIKRSEELEAATIERCAQTVHNLQQRADADREYIFAFNDAIREAVSAIRAIKDKP